MRRAGSNWIGRSMHDGCATGWRVERSEFWGSGFSRELFERSSGVQKARG
jgi:hypothetical protein